MILSVCDVTFQTRIRSNIFDLVKYICRFVSLNKTRGYSCRLISLVKTCPALAAIRLPCARALDTKRFT